MEETGEADESAEFTSAYFEKHRAPVEEAVRRALAALFTQEPDEPLRFLAEHLVSQTAPPAPQLLAESLTLTRWTTPSSMTSASSTPPVPTSPSPSPAPEPAPPATGDTTGGWTTKALEASKAEASRLAAEVERLRKQLQTAVAGGACSECEPGATRDVSALPPEGAQAENAWTARAFASSLGVAGEVAEALLDGAAVPAGGEFEFMQSLAGRPDDIKAKLRNGRLVERVAKMLSKGAEEKLKTAEAKTGAELNDKFSGEEGTFQLAFGSLETFYGGLEVISALILLRCAWPAVLTIAQLFTGYDRPTVDGQGPPRHVDVL